ncbi:AGE family epimerase/isomerase [Actinoalloteichus fjordicus]|uniref:N-acyl-D-glucosamine 2-epimerase n=1 Tax=Actinoalloteichus fjordicus TaxID=1612552 RepID=A0AAC9L9H7_9PSEU|nr:AGE family epimerase/isomerase [Actinoalloteichus fjordicus]APU13587.1 N-acyl-D-glucosamine 2-epimerase [Actinoalloteichus fjordicus]
MAAERAYTFSDTTAGYLEDYQDGRIRLRTLDGRRIALQLTESSSGQLLRNLGGPPVDVTGSLADHLRPGRLLFAYGPVYPEADGLRYQVSSLLFVESGNSGDDFVFETPEWWTDQLRALAGFYRRAQFGAGEVDFADYRTELRLGGDKNGRHVQETDTISRLVYGMSSAYLLTGEEDFLTVADRGSGYLREHMRFVDTEQDVTYWYHGIDVDGMHERKLFTSEFDDDYHAIPAYEQIYALVGLVQTYRVTGDPAIRRDIEGTIRLFRRFFADPRRGGYFSHIDPVRLSPHEESLGRNRSRKNWNSVGDHAPAYLFNLYLATGDPTYRDMLEHTFDMIVSHFPDRGPGGSPFVQERFHEDWSPDREWGWQQDRAVVGHNLKIAWNLTRMNAAVPKFEYQQLARRLAETMPAIGRDPQRGGWYDVLERQPRDGRHDFVWHDRKAWWQQEQAILAYLVLAGHTGDADHLRHAREAEAFYNAFFLDHDEGGVYFTVLAEGLPYLLGTERLKGSHSMSMYHAAELCYLATVYSRLLVRREPLDLWFRPGPDADFPDGLLRVAPDVLPPGRTVLDRVLVDGEPFTDFDPDAMAVRLPRSASPLTVQARLRPVEER